MPPEIAKLMYDMIHAAERIERFAAGITSEDYRTDELRRSAIERQFEIIGEAMTRLIKMDRNVAEKITDFARLPVFEMRSFTDTTRSMTRRAGASSRSTCRCSGWN
jgi:uncharacterized protein with HEPN domain